MPKKLQTFLLNALTDAPFNPGFDLHSNQNTERPQQDYASPVIQLLTHNLRLSDELMALLNQSDY